MGGRATGDRHRRRHPARIRRVELSLRGARRSDAPPQHALDSPLSSSMSHDRRTLRIVGSKRDLDAGHGWAAARRTRGDMPSDVEAGQGFAGDGRTRGGNIEAGHGFAGDRRARGGMGGHFGAPHVLIIGSANVDFTVAAPRLPVPGETVTEGTLLVNHGGKGANQAVAARRLGAHVRLVGCVGDDDSGRSIRQALSAEGVGVDGLVVTADAATGTALIVVDREGRNQITVAPGANRALSVEHVSERAQDFGWADVVVASLEVPVTTAAWALQHARRQRAITLLNPAPLPAVPLDFLGVVDYVTPNAGEAERMTGLPVRDPDTATEAGRRLRQRGAGIAIVTLGEGGAVAYAEDGVTHVPAFAITAVDTTAAGDAFTGGLAVALAEGRALAAALTFASAAAALACTRRGAQASLPTRAEVERLLGTEIP